MNCKKCEGPTSGYKCDICGEESVAHVETHTHGGAHCMPKCTGCNEAEVKCSCK